MSTKKLQIIGSLGTQVEESAVLYNQAQDLTEEQKTQALTNLGVYTQDDEPTDAEVGTLWIDTDEEGGEGGNGTSIALDTTLTQEGMAADAKAVGGAIAAATIIVDSTVSESSNNAVSSAAVATYVTEQLSAIIDYEEVAF